MTTIILLPLRASIAITPPQPNTSSSGCGVKTITVLPRHCSTRSWVSVEAAPGAAPAVEVWASIAVVITQIRISSEIICRIVRLTGIDGYWERSLRLGDPSRNRMAGPSPRHRKFYAAARIEIAMFFRQGYNSPAPTQSKGDLNYAPSSHRIPDSPSTCIADYGPPGSAGIPACGLPARDDCPKQAGRDACAPREFSATVGRPKYRDRDRSISRQSHRLGQT